jgi:hypothetical protein
MSKIALSGNASGTGTFTIASPNSNSDRTLNLPDNSGTVLTTATPGVPVNGPAFSATRSGTQSVTSSTFTKIQYNLEEFDTNSNYDSTTNFRFTPTVAGYYQVNAAVSWPATSGFSVSIVYKNGSAAKWGSIAAAAGGGTLSTVSALIYLNGTTDYVEAYTYQTGGTQNVATAATETYFQASMVRSAV